MPRILTRLIGLALLCMHYQMAEAMVGLSTCAQGIETAPLVHIKIPCDTCEGSSTSSPVYDHCFGTIITHKHVLTSASCVEGKPVARIKVIRRQTFEQDHNEFGVESSITYTEWTYWFNNAETNRVHDIAIITLSRYINRKTIGRAVLSFKANEEYYKRRAVILGWKENQLLQKASVAITTPSECKLKQREIGLSEQVVSEETLCTQSYPFSLLGCDDDGAPLIYKGRLIGVSVGNCLYGIRYVLYQGKVNIHANIYYYQDFIRRMTAGEKLLIAD